MLNARNAELNKALGWPEPFANYSGSLWNILDQYGILPISLGNYLQTSSNFIG